MLRKKLIGKALETEPDFRYRGKETARIEGLSDAVFAFGITLLVVSLEVPSSFDALLASFREFFAFAICIVLLFVIWYEHYIFFLRYGLKDVRTIFTNALLLFLVLFYIFPLKFLFSFFFKFISAVFSPDSEPIIKQLFSEVIRTDQLPQLMALYGIGAAGIYLLFALLYPNALKRKEALKLNTMELFYTRFSIYKNLLMALPPFVSCVVALLLMNTETNAGFFAGLAYSLCGLMGVFAVRERIAQATAIALSEKEQLA